MRATSPCRQRISSDSANFWSFPTPIFMITLWGGMKQPTREWPDSSNESAAFSPRPSRLLRSWWSFLHGLVVLAIAVSSLDTWWKCLLVAGVLAHARWRPTTRVPDFEMVRPGRWSVPSLDRHELVLTAQSRCGGWWIRLVLEDPQGTLEWVLYRDQLPLQSWRFLADRVRAAVCGASDIRVRMR